MSNLHYIPLQTATEASANGEVYSPWSASYSYKPFTLVKSGSKFYLSIDFVPINTLLTDTNYWYCIGDGSATSISDFIGATASTNGVHGLVPEPQAGENTYILGGNGGWNPPITNTQILDLFR